MLSVELGLNRRYTLKLLLDEGSLTRCRLGPEILLPRVRINDATAPSVASAALTLVHGAHHNDR
jgi:hypothetical protein